MIGLQLVVHAANREDIYRDVARVPEKHRLDAGGQQIPEGSVCRVVTPRSSTYVILRGLADSSEPVIRLDERQRNLLGLSQGDEVLFRFEKAGWWGELRWACNASEPAYRLASRLGVVSALLGLLGLLLGLFSFIRGCA